MSNGAISKLTQCSCKCCHYNSLFWTLRFPSVSFIFHFPFQLFSTFDYWLAPRFHSIFQILFAISVENIWNMNVKFMMTSSCSYYVVGIACIFYAEHWCSTAILNIVPVFRTIPVSTFTGNVEFPASFLVNGKMLLSVFLTFYHIYSLLYDLGKLDASLWATNWICFFFRVCAFCWSHLTYHPVYGM